ncbi:MAG: hypothetical protein U1E53_15625 [Dongiaceae bacterium]
MLGIAFASLLVAAAAIAVCVIGLALSQLPALPVRWAAVGREMLRFGATGLAVSGCGVLLIVLAPEIAARARPGEIQGEIQAAAAGGDAFISGGGRPARAPPRPWP